MPQLEWASSHWRPFSSSNFNGEAALWRVSGNMGRAVKPPHVPSSELAEAIGTSWTACCKCWIWGGPSAHIYWESPRKSTGWNTKETDVHEAVCASAGEEGKQEGRPEHAQYGQHLRDEAQDAAAAATGMPESRALLGDVRVVLIGTKMPVTIGMVARACGSFEVGSLVLVAPRTNPLQRSALRASKGALQHSLSAGKLRWIVADSLEEALEGSSHAVAMTRLDIPEDLSSESPPTAGQDDAAAGTLGGPDEAREGAIWARLQRKQMEGLRGLSRFLSTVRQQAHEERRGTLTLIFGREDAGFEQAELDRGEVVGICSIPMSCRFGTESLSLSQAVPIVLARLYEDSQQPPPPGMPSPGR